MKFYTLYFISSLFNHVYIFIRCISFSSWLGLACIVLFLIFTVHSYVSANFKKKNAEEEKVARYQELAFEIKRIHRASKVIGDTNRDWCTWNSLKECKDLAWEARHT